MVEYKTTNTKAELLEIAAANGIEADDSMTKTQIIGALDAYNAAESGEATTATDNTEATENAAQSVTEGAQSESNYNPDEYDMFVYAGPSLPGGKLKENAVFRGTFDDVLKYLSDVLEKYPQAEKLIVPTHKLAVFSAKVKTPGNIAHKYYNDIVSTMRNHKEV